MKLNAQLSDIIILLFLGITLYFRFNVQPQLGNHYLISLFLGLLPLLFLYVLIRWKVLNPNYFGLRKNQKHER